MAARNDGDCARPGRWWACRRSCGAGSSEVMILVMRVGEDPAVAGGPHRPAALMDEPVVHRTEPRGVVQAGGSAVAPPDDVMQFGDGSAAAAERAPVPIA